jgi:methylated-DNA-[protein]-cysteine S-methyltransferase
MTTMDTHLCHAVVATPIGPLTLVASPTGLREVRFPNGRPVGPADGPERPDQTVLAAAAGQLGEYFDGSRLEFDVPLDPQGSPFQLAAWRALATIPYGETVSYGEQARRLGHDGKARAIGAANGSNPLPLILPCHRVVGSDGSLVGFGGGLPLKAWLLHHERAVLGLELPLTAPAPPPVAPRRR